MSASLDQHVIHLLRPACIDVASINGSFVTPLIWIKYMIDNVHMMFQLPVTTVRIDLIISFRY